jgi:hypothetical protein
LGVAPRAFGVDHAACSVTLRSSVACPVLLCSRAGPWRTSLHHLRRSTDRRAKARGIPQSPRRGHGFSRRIAKPESKKQGNSPQTQIEISFARAEAQDEDENQNEEKIGRSDAQTGKDTTPARTVEIHKEKSGIEKNDDRKKEKETYFARKRDP